MRATVAALLLLPALYGCQPGSDNAGPADAEPTAAAEPTAVEPKAAEPKSPEETLNMMRVGTPYAEARATLIAGGWQPETYRPAYYHDFMSDTEAYIFDDLGYRELCAAGNASVTFVYRDAYQNVLEVQVPPEYEGDTMPVDGWEVMAPGTFELSYCAGFAP